MKIRQEKPALNNFKAYRCGKNEKPRRGFLINGFPVQILLPKSKEERIEVTSGLLSLLLHRNYKNI